jgi:hypothetical protein
LPATRFFLKDSAFSGVLTSNSGSTNQSEGAIVKNFVKLCAWWVLIFPLMLTGCAFWHSHVVSPPPAYKLYPSAGLLYRLDSRNWEKAGESVSNDITSWNAHYTNALKEIYPWVLDANSFYTTFTNAAREYGITDPAYLDAIPKQAYSSLVAYLNSEYSTDATNGSIGNVRRMFERADVENSKLLSADNAKLKDDPSDWHIPLSLGNPPLMTSPEIPVGVSLTAQWNENPSAKNATSTGELAGTNTMQATFDKLTVTFQGQSSTNSNSRGPQTGDKPVANGNLKDQAKDKDTTIADFQEDQTVNLSVSTMLNSASTLDRIDSVSTYVYVYPMTSALNGNVVLEREFWMNFLGYNLSRDPLIRTNRAYVNADLSAAIEHLRMKVHDLSTMVDYGTEDLGSDQQAFSNTGTAGVTGSAKSSPFTTISPTANFTESASATTTTTPKEQIDQRSTYIDGKGDFFRINLRGLESLDLAGRFKENVTIHIPAADEGITVLIPPGNTNDDDYCELQEVSQPIYSQMDAITFSVAVAREITKLSANTEDRYGLNDRNDAAFVVGVTAPEHIVLWQWERSFPEISTWDIFGKVTPSAQMLYFNLAPGDVPSPLCVSDNFQLPDLLKLFNAIRSARTNFNINSTAYADTNGIIHLKTGNGFIDIGCVTNEADPQLVPLPASVKP